MQTPYFIPVVSLAIASIVWIWSWIHRKRYFTSAPEGVGQRISTMVYPYIRPIVYSLALMWAGFLYVVAVSTTPTIHAALSVLMRNFALTGLAMLGLTLIPGLLSVYFPRWSMNGLIIHARRALGLSAFGFIATHGTLGFLFNLSANLLSIFYLAPRNQIALLCSSVAFIILTLMAITSIDSVEKKLGPVRWKRLHRFVYWAAILAVIHAFMIGSHFTKPQAHIPAITNISALTLLLLEAGATLIRLGQQKRFGTWQGRLITLLLTVLLVSGFWATISIFEKPYDPHSAHRAGYSRNYIAHVTTEPVQIVPNQPVAVKIRIEDKRTGQTVTKFQTVQEKLMHLMVISRDLEAYQHIHPDIQPDGTFTTTITVPKEGTYTLYIEYSPPDFLENVSFGTIKTTQASSDEVAQLVVDERSKTYGDTTVSLSTPAKISVNDTVDFAYTLKDAKTGAAVADIQPYLAAFGHLAVVSQDSQTYTHVHPIDVPLVADQVGGPRVRFSTFFQKKGLYKLFAQFKRNDEVFVTDFVVEVQ
jgi:DMSO/TMAO reductase YedYZ heme-binding membrane subunit